MLWRSGLLFLLLALLGGCKEETLAQGEIAPALAAFDMQGKEASLDRWRGKSIYLNFWSASCGGCLAEMDTLEALSKRWGEKVMVVAVNTDPASVPLEALLAQHAITYPVLRDQLNITQERYRVIGTPTSVMIDAQGRVLDLHQGARTPRRRGLCVTRESRPRQRLLADVNKPPDIANVTVRRQGPYRPSG